MPNRIWDPQTRMGDNPFDRFATWQDLINEYAVPANLIRRRGGPGDAIEDGEWYLTVKDKVGAMGDVWGFLSYVKEGTSIFHKKIRLYNLQTAPSPDVTASFWQQGGKNGWGVLDEHYVVDFTKVKNKNIFMNWGESPFENEVRGIKNE